MKISNGLSFWAYACILCGMLLFANGAIAETQSHGATIANTPITLVASIFGLLGSFGFLFAYWALQSFRVAGSGWLSKLSGGFIITGLILGVMGSIYTLPDPNRVQWLTPLGSVSVSLGWLAFGIGVLRSRILQSWQRFVPLILGLYFFIQFPLQFFLFISVRGYPSYLIVVGGYGVLIAILGSTIFSLIKRPITSMP